jgi:PAS domain S-box-containing protein
MSANPSNSISKPGWQPMDQPHPFQTVVWISISVAFVLAFLDLAGWIFDISALKSILPHWTPMKIITAVCFVLTAISLIIIQLSLNEVLRKVLSGVSAIFIITVSILTIYVYLFSVITGHESQLTGVSFLKFFIAPESRMALLSGFNFLLVGFILYFLRGNRRRIIGLAHVFVIPVIVISYFAIISYILGIYSSTELLKTPVALNTGIAFCGICVAVLLMFPETWLTGVFTSGEIGGTIARRLLPGLLFLPVIIGWFRIQGEQKGLYRSEEGVVFVAITYVVCFFALVWITTRAANRIDLKRRASEKVVKELNAKLDLALSNASIGVWEWDISTNAINWDERMENIFGIKPGTFEGNYDAFESFLVDEDIAHVRKGISSALDFDAPFETVYRIKLKNGDIKHINAKALVNRDHEGKPFRMTGVCFDITEMKKGAEQNLFKLNEELLRSNKELEQFAYVASHDLQEPLRMISSFTQLLSQRYKDKLDHDADEFIQFAVEGANRMQRLINDLLEYSRVETKGKSLSETDMQNVLGHAINNLKLIINEKAALITNDELPVVLADAGQIIQLLQNLLGNSLKFCEISPKIHISAVEEKEYFQFSVKDNGIGIEPQYFDRIFSIFQRLHQKEEYEGTGIGLAICRRIVERHGGKIWVESIPGIGTTFKFTLRKKQ